MSGAGELLRGAAAGQRWVVRVRQPDGSATDVVGWLAGPVGPAATVAALDGPVPPTGSDADAPRWTVALADVLAARRAPAARGGPGPARTPAAVLEHVALEAWAAEVEPLGDWALRAASGFTGRANSCLAVGDPGLPPDAAAARVEAYAAAHGIAPMAQVVTGSDEDAALRALGWHETYVATDVLAVRLADLLGEHAPDPRVVVDDRMTDGWRAAFDAYRPGDADPAAVTAVLEGRRPRAFARVEEAGGSPGETVTIARGHLSGGWLGVAAVWTRPDRRRQGLGTAVVRALGHWAARRDARGCYLQVETENEAAHAAYARLGFTLHHRYHYLAPPGAR